MQETFYFSTVSRPAVGPTQHPIQCFKKLLPYTYHLSAESEMKPQVIPEIAILCWVLYCIVFY